MANQKLSRFYGYIFPLAIALPKIAFLAKSPQNPDGSELVSVAIRGGVPHPPGLPLQAWLDRAAVFLFPQQPALTLSGLSLFFHFLSLCFLYQLLLRLKVNSLFAVLSLVLYAYYPPVFDQTVQPEKYSLILLLTVGLLFFLERITAEEGRKSRQPWIITSIIVGLALGQHYFSLILLPAYVIGSLDYLSTTKERRVEGGIIVGSAIIPLLLYGSLPFLRTDSVWPDWGKLHGIKSIFSNIFGLNHGFFHTGGHTLMNFSSVDSINALDLLISSLLSNWNIALLLCIAGGVVLFKKNSVFLLSCLSILFCTLIFLLLFNLPSVLTNMGYLERYTCLVFPVLIVFLAMGIQAAADFEKKKYFWIVLPLIFGLTGFQIFLNQNRYEAFQNSILQNYREMVALDLPKESVFVSVNDFGMFYGFPTKGGTRFPLVNEFDEPWYTSEVAFRLEPKIRAPIEDFEKLNFNWKPNDLVIKLDQIGISVSSTEPALLQSVNSHEVARGFVYFTLPQNNREPLARRNIEIGLELCDRLSKETHLIPSSSHYFTQDILMLYPVVFLQMAQYLKDNGNSAAANAAADLAQVLKADVNPLVWRQKCQNIASLSQVH